MTKAKPIATTVRLRKALPLYGGGELPAGTEITVTDEWESIPPGTRGRLIVDRAGDRRLVSEEDLEYALGAH